MTEIPISGRVLKWARDYRGLSVEEAAERLGMSVDDLTDYETEKRKPTLTRFEKIASTYRLPQATLFRKTPPNEPKAPTDFRTIEGGRAGTSFDFRVALSTVRAMQATIARIQEEDDQFTATPLRNYRLSQDPMRIGEDERTDIGVSIDAQLAWDAGSGFRHWRAIIERQGIAVYQQKFEITDCRGCSLWDDDTFPAIIINKTDDYDAAKTFTLIHEYAHLLIRKPGISDLRNGNKIEAFCNRFAAAFLMPVAALRRALSQWPDRVVEWEDNEVRYAARKLNVSAQALAIRLEELGKAKSGLNRRFVYTPTQKKKRENQRPDYVKTRLSELGGKFTATVLTAFDREIIDRVEASQALAIKPPQFEKVREYIDRQIVLARSG